MATKATARVKVSQYIYGDFLKPDHWFGKFVEPINRMYCETHGYDYVVDRLDSVRPDRHGNWEKVPHILRNLTDCDYLFFLDADAVFYSHVIALHEELLPWMEPQHLMLFSVDCGGESFRWSPNLPNAGAGLYRNVPEVKDFLTEWDAASDLPEWQEYRWKWCLEQRILMRYLYPKYKDKIKVLREYYIICSLHGQFIRHVFSNSIDRYTEFEQIYNSPLMARNRVLAQTINKFKQYVKNNFGS